MHNKSIKNIGAKVIGIVGLPVVSYNIRGFFFKNFSGKKHADALSADKARSYFPFRGIKNIPKGKIFND